MEGELEAHTCASSQQTESKLNSQWFTSHGSSEPADWIRTSSSVCPKNYSFSFCQQQTQVPVVTEMSVPWWGFTCSRLCFVVHVLSSTRLVYVLFSPSPAAGVRADPSGGPGPEGDPPAGSGGRGILGEHPAGWDLHPAEEVGPRSALGGLAPAGGRWLRFGPLTDGKVWKEEKEKKNSWFYSGGPTEQRKPLSK